MGDLSAIKSKLNRWIRFLHSINLAYRVKKVTGNSYLKYSNGKCSWKISADKLSLTKIYIVFFNYFFRYHVIFIDRCSNTTNLLRSKCLYIFWASRKLPKLFKCLFLFPGFFFFVWVFCYLLHSKTIKQEKVFFHKWTTRQKKFKHISAFFRNGRVEVQVFFALVTFLRATTF